MTGTLRGGYLISIAYCLSFHCGLFLLHLNLLLCLSWFPTTSLSCDCHVTRNHVAVYLSPDS